MKTKKKAIYIFLSCLISAVLIYLLLTQISTRDLALTIKNLYWPSLLVYMLISLSGAVVRSWRYRLLLQPERISWPGIVLVTLVKNSLIDLLPARIGSLSYIYLLNRRLGLPFEPVTASFVAAFLLDFLTLSPFLITAILMVGLGVDAVASSTVLFVAGLFFFAVILAFILIVPLARLWLKIYVQLGQIVKLEEKNWFRQSVNKTEGTIAVLNSTRRHQSFWLIFLLSFLIRLAKYSSLFFLLHSLLRSHGFSLAALSFWRLILGTSGAELTSALPVKGIAGFGTWESAWALTFRLMGSEPQLAIISGLGIHFLTNLFEYTLGIGSLFLLALPRFRRPANQRRVE